MARTQVQLPDGGTATIRDPASVTERQRRPVTRLQVRLVGSSVGQLLTSEDDADSVDVTAFGKAAMAVMTADDIALLDELNDALIVALVERVDIGDLHIESLTLDNLLDLPGPAYDALKVETAKYVTALMPSFAPTSDDKSPTPPSAD